MLLALVCATLSPACGSRSTSLLDLRADHTVTSDRGRDTTATSDALQGCFLKTESACWQCGACTQGQHAVVGCRALGDCRLFCTICMPNGYSRCSFGGPGESDPDCANWTPPIGTFAGCEKTAHGDNGDLYCCAFCPSSLNADTFAQGPDGTCYRFCSSCIPRDFHSAQCQP